MITSSFGFLLPLLSLPPYPISRHPLCSGGHHHCHQMHPRSPGAWPHPRPTECSPPCRHLAQSLESLRRPARDMAFDGCSRSTPLLPYPETHGGKQDEPHEVGWELNGIVPIKQLEQNLGPCRKCHYSSFLPGLFYCSLFNRFLKTRKSLPFFKWLLNEGNSRWKRQ